MRHLILAVAVLLAGMGQQAGGSTFQHGHGGRAPFQPTDPLDFPPVPPLDRCAEASVGMPAVAIRRPGRADVYRARGRGWRLRAARPSSSRPQDRLSVGPAMAALAAPAECDHRGPPIEIAGPGGPPRLVSAALPGSAAGLLPALLLLGLYARMRHRNRTAANRA